MLLFAFFLSLFFARVNGAGQMISATVVEYDGYEYRAMMPGVLVDGTATTCHGGTCRPLPSGYEIAPNDPDVINNVIVPFNWNTHIMVTYSSAGVSGGYPGYTTDSYGRAGQEYSPGNPKAIACSGGWQVPYCSYQILIRKPIPDPTKAPSTSPTEYIHNADLGTVEFCGSAIFNGENVFVYNSRQTERANYDDWDTFCMANAKGVAIGGNGNHDNDCDYAMSQIETVTSFQHQSDDYPPNRSHGSTIYMFCTVNTELGFVDDTSCQWHALNKMNKVINANQFFGFECPPNQIISELRLEGYGARSVLENNPTAILCCELGGYSLVTNACVDSYSTADGILEAAICQGNSAMAAIYDLSDPTLEQGQWQYQATKAVTCCDIEYDTSYGHNLDLGIDRSQCEVISHSNQVGSFDVSCPEDMILIAIRDNDLAHGVQEVHEVECCKVHQATAPSKAPTATPTTDQPSSAPTTSCYQCLIGVHENDVSDQDDFVDEIQACLSHCCA